jgi:hypothetical protein
MATRLPKATRRFLVLVPAGTLIFLLRIVLGPWPQQTNIVILPTRALLHFPSNSSDRLCGLVVRVLGYRSGGPGSISGTTRKKI